MSLPTMHSGFRGTAVIGNGSAGHELNIISWSLSNPTEIQKFKTSQNNGYPQKEATWRDANGSVTIEFDFSNNPFISSGPNITTGATLTNLTLYLNQSAVSSFDGKFWQISSAIVTNIRQSVEIEGKIKTSFDWENTGSVTAPV